MNSTIEQLKSDMQPLYRVYLRAVAETFGILSGALVIGLFATCMYYWLFDDCELFLMMQEFKEHFDSFSR